MALSLGTQETMVQAEQSLAAWPDFNELARRRRNGEAGRLRAYPLGDVTEMQLFKRNQLAIAVRMGDDSPYTSTGPHGRPLITTNVNGMAFGSAADADELAAAHWAVGVVKTDADGRTRGVDNASGLGVTAAGGGVFTPHRGTDHIYPGDPLRFTFPSFDTRPGQSGQYGEPKGFLAPIIRPVRKSDALLFHHRLVRELLRPRGANGPLYEESARGLDPEHGHGQTKSAVDKAAMALGDSVTTGLLRALEPLLFRGVVKIMTPEERQREALADDVLKKIADGTLDAPEIADAKTKLAAIIQTDVSAPGGPVNATYADEDEARRSTAYSFFREGLDANSDPSAIERSLLWLARALGVVGEEEEQETVWIRDVLESALYGFGATASRLYAPLGPSAGETQTARDIRETMNRAMYGGFSGRSLSTEHREQYIRRALAHRTRFAEACSYALRRAAGTHIGRAEALAVPGKTAHVQLTLTPGASV